MDETPDAYRIRGNQKDEILLAVEPGTRDQVLQYIQSKRESHPLNVAADYDASAPGFAGETMTSETDPCATLSDMIAEELDTERFLEPEVVEKTVLLSHLYTRPGRSKAKNPQTEVLCCLRGKVAAGQSVLRGLRKKVR